MSQKIKKKKIVYSILIIIRRWNDVETKRFHEIFLIIFNIFILLFIKLRVTFQQGKNKYGSILDPKKKKKRSYEKEIITRINWFDYFWDNWYTHSTEHLQFCNWYHSPMLQVHNSRCSIGDRKEERKEVLSRRPLPLLALQRIFTKVVFLDLHVASRHRSYFKHARMHEHKHKHTHAAWPHSSRKV